MNTLIAEASSDVPLMLNVIKWLFLLALLEVVFSVPYLAFKAWQRGRGQSAPGASGRSGPSS